MQYSLFYEQTQKYIFRQVFKNIVCILFVSVPLQDGPRSEELQQVPGGRDGQGRPGLQHRGSVQRHRRRKLPLLDHVSQARQILRVLKIFAI